MKGALNLSVHDCALVRLNRARDQTIRVCGKERLHRVRNGKNGVPMNFFVGEKPPTPCVCHQEENREDEEEWRQEESTQSHSRLTENWRGEKSALPPKRDRERVRSLDRVAEQSKSEKKQYPIVRRGREEDLTLDLPSLNRV